MTKYVIGCDPDSAGNGIALFVDGKLIEIMNLSAVEFYCRYKKLKKRKINLTHEDSTMANCASVRRLYSVVCQLLA